jgi:hypothetical protein
MEGIFHFLLDPCTFFYYGQHIESDSEIQVGCRKLRVLRREVEIKMAVSFYLPEAAAHRDTGGGRH